MGRTKFVTIATFLTPDLAHIARARLDAEGIPAFLENESAVSMISVLSNAVGGVKLQVDASDFERASEILGLEDEDEDPSSSIKADAFPWICGQCGEESEATFSICWFCGASRDGEVEPAMIENTRSRDADDDLLESSSPSIEHNAAILRDDDLLRPSRDDDDNPYRSPQALYSPTNTANKVNDHSQDVNEEETPDELALRAYRAALLGLLFSSCVILLNGYSMYLLAKIAPDQLSAPIKTRYFVAVAVNLAIALLIGFLVFHGFIYDLVNDRRRMW